MHGRLLLAAVIVISVGMTGCGQEPEMPDLPVETYQSATDLGAFEAESEANDINDARQVVGVSDGRAFLWQEGTMTDLGTLNFQQSEALAINGSGQVAGTAGAPEGDASAAFLWENGEMRDLGLPDPPSEWQTHGRAMALNDAGDVVGTVSGGPDTSPEAMPRAYVWRADGNISQLPTDGGTAGLALGINYAGIVVGGASMPDDRHHIAGARWSGGTLSRLQSLGGMMAMARDINNSGLIVGYSSLPEEFHNRAVTWRNGQPEELSLLPVHDHSEAHAVNHAGIIVGFSGRDFDTPEGRDSERRAVRWIDGEVEDLNRLLPPDSGWLLLEARGINNRGDIVGVGMRNGSRRAFLLWAGGSGDS
jgi:probable HAF family extracellular repeat protein